MTVLTDIIQINISRETAAVAQTNFNVPMFVSAHTKFAERARSYSSLAAVGEDFGPSDTAYVAAQRLFGQALTPAKIVIGRRLVPTSTVSITAAAAGTYTLTVNEVPFTYVATGNPTMVSIATGLKTAYDVTPVADVTLTNNGDGTLTLASAVGYSLAVSANMTQADSPSTESWISTINAITTVDNTWYALMIESHVQAEVLAVAGQIEGMKKVFGTSSQANDVLTTGTDDTFSKLKALGYQRTFGIYSEKADTEFPEAAWVGYQLQEQPGSNTWAYKALSGVTVAPLSDTESTNVHSKSASTYETVGGLNSTIGAKMFGGEWIDVMIFVDWLEQRMKERLWSRMANSKKIPYTSAGTAIIEAEIRAQLNDGIRVGGLANSPSPTVSVPDVLSVSQVARANRIFEGVTFEARLAGAIHFVKIAGTVTV
ncbi:putative structural protein [Pseudomonas phage PPSC2]|uniref:Putative structural protein n=1 Tax=Pseudomonas phage PPSC2 TaxID=2041350 RepID=A0A2R2YAJ2_9CAUD|nr:putative structural protein [Pseudomonas phage PPSC2]ATN92775.1 putative structural protein [Pseudomonas phage PPSC2]